MQANDDCELIAFDLASPYVQEKLLDQEEVCSMEWVEEFVSRVKGQDTLAKMRGDCHERICRAWITAGGKLVMRELGVPGAATQELELPVQEACDCVVLPFGQLGPSTFYYSKNRRFPAIDALSTLRWVFHDVNCCEAGMSAGR